MKWWLTKRVFRYSYLCIPFFFIYDQKMKNLLDHLFNWITFFKRPVFSKSLEISDSHQTAIRQSISKWWTFESKITIDELNTSALASAMPIFYPHNLVLRHQLLRGNSQVKSSVTFLIGQRYWRHSKRGAREINCCPMRFNFSDYWYQWSFLYFLWEKSSIWVKKGVNVRWSDLCQSARIF